MTRLILALAVALLFMRESLAEETCPYLTNAEVEKATGQKLDLFRLKAMALPDGTGTMCESPAGGVMFLSGPGSAERFAAMAEGQGRKLDGKAPVPELGEGAYSVYLPPRNESEKPTVLVIVTLASGTAVVSVRGETGALPESLKPQAVELAKIAVTRAP